MPEDIDDLMYLKYVSKIGLMMTVWVETCGHFNWQ